MLKVCNKTTNAIFYSDEGQVDRGHRKFSVKNLDRMNHSSENYFCLALIHLKISYYGPEDCRLADLGIIYCPLHRSLPLIRKNGCEGD